MEENKMKQPASADAPQTAEDSVLHVDRDRAQQKTKDIDMETAPEKPVSAHKCLESMPLKILGLLGICALIIGEVFVITGLYLGAQYRDFGRWVINAYASWGNTYMVPLVFACIIGLAAMIALVIFELLATGHRKDGQVHIYWIDRIPFDLFTLLALTLISIYFVMGIESYLLPSLIDHNFITGLWVFSAFLDAGAMLIAIYFLSLARRVKAHAFLKNNIIFWICHGIKKFFLFLWKLIPNFWKRMMLLLALVIVQIVLLVSYADASWGWGEIPHTWVFVLVLLLTIAFVLWSWWMQKQCFEEAQAIRAGDLSKKIPEEKLKYMTGALKSHAEDLNSIRDGVEDAVAVRLKSEHLKTELITNVSHDIKTPLTSIISYVDLLSKEHTEEEEKQYIDVLKRQTERLRKLTEDVLEASKADSGNVEVHLEKTSAAEIVDQAVGEYKEKLDAANLTTVVDVPEDLYVTADGKLLWRVLRNLLSNAAKYSAPGSRVYITAAPAIPDSGYATIEIKNISKDMLNVSADELMERFIRGDSSRHTEGSGLGLDIAKSLTTLMGGFFEIAIDGDLFKAIVRLPQAK